MMQNMLDEHVGGAAATVGVAAQQRRRPETFFDTL